MSRRLRATVAALLVLAGPLLLPASAIAQTGRVNVDRQVFLFLVDRVSFEALLGVPEIRALARAGGAALLSPNTPPGDEGPGAYLTLGTGVRSVGPEPRVLAFDAAENVSDHLQAQKLWSRHHPRVKLPPEGPLLVDLSRYLDANEHRAPPGLLGSTLALWGRHVAELGNADTTSLGRDRPGVLVGMGRLGAVEGGRVGFAYVPSANPLSLQSSRAPLALKVPGALGGYRTELGTLVFAAGGPAEPRSAPYINTDLTIFDMGDTLRIDRAAPGADPALLARQQKEALSNIGVAIEVLVHRATSHDVMVMVVTPSVGWAQKQVKDELTGIVMATGEPDTLFDHHGPMHTMTSDTTRRVGLVSNEDVAPTILSFFRIAIPGEMNGSAIRPVDTPAPFALHARHLEARRLAVPMQTGAGIAVTLAGLVAMAAVALRRKVRGVGRWIAAVPMLGLPGFAAAMLAAGRLPHLTYREVVPFVAVVALGVGVVAAAYRRFGVLVPPVVAGGFAVAVLLAEAWQRWPDARFTLLGGTALDGWRFYGMPNVEVGLLLGSMVWLVAGLSPYAGAVLLFAAGLFAGFPELGVNVGGAVTLFAASGLWYFQRTRGRLSWKELGWSFLVVVVGMVAILAANRWLASTPTHATRFVEHAPGRGVGGLVRVVWDRFLVGVRILVRNPFGFVPVLGLPVVLWFILRPRPAMAEAFRRRPAWRDAMLVTVLASIVAYLANDSGVTAAGLGFGMAVAGMLYLPLAEPVEPEPTTMEPAWTTTTP